MEKIHYFNEIRMNGVHETVDCNEVDKFPELISVIIRTIQRPHILWEAVQSVLDQIYSNFEIIIIEDGEPISGDFLKGKSSDPRIHYYFTDRRIGRSAAGNLGMRYAKGKYLIFLDDDDIFFPNHLEILANELITHPSYVAAYSLAYEVPIRVFSVNPYTYKEFRGKVQYAQPFNRLRLMMSNYIPIQSILFRRDLYKKAGGFDESLELLEDWDLWIRYSLFGDFIFVPIITSKYHVPKNHKDLLQRSRNFEFWENKIRENQKKQIFSTSIAQIKTDMSSIIAENSNIRRIFIYGLTHPRIVLRKIFLEKSEV